MMDIGYYPGCALHGSSNDYETSVTACLGALGVRLKEVDDWICCGATAAHSLNSKLAVALPARNLALAERDGLGELLAPCPMCSMELLKAKHELASQPDLRREIADIVELPIDGKTAVLNLIDVFRKVGLDKVKASVKTPLTSVRAACYYGCLLTRPADVVQFDDCEQPTSSMEVVLAAVGAEPVEWNYRTECCGAGMTMANEETVLELSHKILSNAQAHGANCLVVACPMCHVNLDMKQADVERRGTSARHGHLYYLSDLVGWRSAWSRRRSGVDRHFVVKG
jgi:heterodisulfide reductase subunit B2